jgi:hypothetical protein
MTSPATSARIRGLLAVGLCAQATSQESRPSEPLGSAPAQSRPARLRHILIETRNVYSFEQAKDNALYEGANWLHFTTDPEVLRRELWLEPGDRIRVEEVEELERNLRAMGLFGGVEARLVPAGAEQADLEIRARDRFSLVVGAAAGYVGGVVKFNASVSEHNLFGTGKEITTQVRTSEDEHLAEVAWFDPQLAGSWHQLGLAAGVTEEGYYTLVDLTRPFKHLEDPMSWGISALTEERDVDYFEQGVSVAQVPKSSVGARTFLSAGFGPRDLRGSVAIDLRASATDWEPAQGRDAALIQVPGDVLRAEFGPLVTLDYAHAYQKVTGIDAIDYIEDIRLGAALDGRYASVWRDEKGAPDEFQRLLDVGGEAAVSPFAQTWFTFEARTRLRFEDAEMRGWATSGAIHAYQKSLPAQTLALSLAADAAEERQDLVPQFTLGEDNGLRGYPAREFAGQRRLRFNLEDRIYTGLELWSVHIGLVAFFDAGWVWNIGQPLSFDDAIKSAGFGLRLGSSELFGPNVLRMDLAFPLDHVNGQGYSMSLSASLNQVFSFFGNRQELRSEF